jgi:hypothetical protein
MWPELADLVGMNYTEKTKQNKTKPCLLWGLIIQEKISIMKTF